MEIKRYKIIWGYEELQETKSTDCRNCEIVVKYSDIKHLLGQPKIDNLIEWAEKVSFPDYENGGEIISLGGLLDKAKEIRDDQPQRDKEK